MKKNIFAAIVFSVCTGTALLFSSCQGVIFSTIRDEVELDDAEVAGDINSIVRYTYNSKDYLFLQNGKIWYKDVTTNPTTASPYSGQWISEGTPNGYVFKIAADPTYLYALTLTYEDDEDEGENVVSGKYLYYSADNGATWTISSDIKLTKSSTVTLFCTNTPQSAHRSAYINLGGTVYLLNGASATALTSSSSGYYFADGEAIPTAYTTSTNPISATYFSGSVYFSSHYAMTSNETASTDATYMYYGDDDTIYYGDATTTWTAVDVDDGDIYSIAVTADYFLLGTSDGLIQVTNSSGVPGSSTVDFTTNADSTLSSYYEVWCVLAVDPSLAETAGDLYGTTVFTGSSSSTSATFDNVGLWAYYPGRGKWNRE